jgi:tetratricopeptide (TPR) repeat protein
VPADRLTAAGVILAAVSVDHDDRSDDASGAGAPTGVTTEVAGGELGSMASLLAGIARTPRPPALRPGTIVGDQYRVDGLLGRGGMGVVYRARDLRLDRDVAIKVGLAVSADALARIEREAKALARLAHPNVVVVYQVGTIDGRVFVALELVGGGTARDWQAARPRGWRDVVALYAAVGDGLAAAHAAGLVHRDVKPDNVLVGADGRPRLADFGVVRADATAPTTPAPDATPGAAVDATTGAGEAGSVTGTRGYMAPEQAAGERIDARADQYALAVTVWEALFGARPGADPPPPAVARGDGDRPPPRLIGALQRALARRPADRWPDVGAFVGALRRAARRGRLGAGTGLAAAAAAAAAIALVVVAAAAPGDAPVCRDAPARIAAVWSPSRRAALAAAGHVGWPALERAIDRRAAAWIDAHTTACTATRVDGLASAALLDDRMLCLAGRRAELAEVVAAIERGDPDVLAGAGPYLDHLPAAAACLDAAPADKEPPPATPALRAAVDAAIPAIAQAQAAALDRGVRDPLETTERAVALARATTWRPMIAAALVLRGEVLHELQRREEALVAFEEAAQLAVASRSDHDAAFAFGDTAKVLADLARFAEAHRALDVARSLWQRSGEDAEIGWRIHNAAGHVAQAEGKPDEMLAAARIQLALAPRAFGDSPTTIAIGQLNLSIALLDAGELTEAAAAADAAIAGYQRALGDHPTTAKAHAQAALIATRAGAPARAIEHGRRALAISERWFGADDPRLVLELFALADAHRVAGELEPARDHMTRALALLRAHEPASPRIAVVEHGLAIIALSRGELAAARTHADAALAAFEARLGADHLELIDPLAVVAAIARDQTPPDLAGSLGYLDRALAIATRALPAGHRRRLNVMIERSYTLLALGRGGEVVAALAPWLDRLATLDVGAQLPHELRYVLGRAYADTSRAARGCALAAAAEDGYRALAAPMADTVAAWRRDRCGRAPS